MAQTVKRLSTVPETQVQFLGQENLEKEMGTHSSILAWKIPWTEEPGRLQSTGLQSWTRLIDFTSLHHYLRSIVNRQHVTPQLTQIRVDKLSTLNDFQKLSDNINWIRPSLGIAKRRQRQPTPVLLPGKCHGQRSLVGCSPWGWLGVGHD